MLTEATVTFEVRGSTLAEMEAHAEQVLAVLTGQDKSRAWTMRVEPQTTVHAQEETQGRILGWRGDVTATWVRP